MIPQWIDHNIYIGPFWMGTPKQIEETQAAIDEEIRLYTGDDYDETTYDEEILEDETVACQAPIQHPIRYR